ncbi:MAG: hypothetical protein ACTHJT_03105, partial [Cytophaga sp.]|uniref:hypothetical protein n=1 Tax=Cytophaga sp. TaxID=29535 RepID=UPI003F7FEC8C
CVIDTSPDWDGDENAPTQCQVVNGANTGHQLILVTDVNPNSPTYNNTQWADMGVNTSACPVSVQPVNVTYYNNSTEPITIRFFSTSNAAETYSFDIHDAEGIMSVPAGNYNVEMYDPNYYIHAYDICSGFYQYDTDVTFYNIDISSGCAIITID